MKISRIDIIGLNGNDGQHYDEPLSIVDALNSMKMTGNVSLEALNDALDTIERLTKHVEQYHMALFEAEAKLAAVELENDELRETATALVEDFKRRSVDLCHTINMGYERPFNAVIEVADDIESLPLIGEK